MSKCPTCTKTVYFAERVTALGKDYHKMCFKCKSCNKLLEVGKFSERDNFIYCKSCYNALFRPRGYGFGGGADSFKGTGALGDVVETKPSDVDHSTLSGSKNPGVNDAPMSSDNLPSAVRAGRSGSTSYKR